jgi:hypothetical protein
MTEVLNIMPKEMKEKSQGHKRHRRTESSSGGGFKVRLQSSRTNIAQRPIPRLLSPKIGFAPFLTTPSVQI